MSVLRTSIGSLKEDSQNWLNGSFQETPSFRSPTYFDGKSVVSCRCYMAVKLHPTASDRGARDVLCYLADWCWGDNYEVKRNKDRGLGIALNISISYDLQHLWNLSQPPIFCNAHIDSEATDTSSRVAWAALMAATGTRSSNQELEAFVLPSPSHKWCNRIFKFTQPSKFALWL